MNRPNTRNRIHRTKLKEVFTYFTDHPNVKCYFGHGGLLGLSEGVQSGVPMVLMPFFGDQYQNAIAAQARGVALVVDFVKLNEQTLKHTLDEIFNNTRYVSSSRLFVHIVQLRIILDRGEKKA